MRVAFIFTLLDQCTYVFIVYVSVSQPFELQVPVEDKFLKYCRGKQENDNFSPQ